MTVPDFSPLAGRYARSRPGYPAALFAYLASLVTRRDVAWDCATGNGQAAVGLAQHFERVLATDISREQILHASVHPRVEYRVAPSESSGLDDGSIDLITVAAAVHWFDLEAFFGEVRRVLRPGGVLAIWTYHVGHVEPPFDRVFHRLYFDVLRPYFAPQVALVDAHYRTVPLPGERVAGSESVDPDAGASAGCEREGRFYVTAEWNLDQVKAFIMSWSGAQKYLEDRGQEPIDTIAEELAGAWGKPDAIHRLQWPIFLHACRLG